MKIKNLLLALFALPLLFVACETQSSVDEVKDPTVTITLGEATQDSIAYTITSTNAEHVVLLVVEGTEAPSASEVLANGGICCEANTTVERVAYGLKADTEYTLVVVAQNSKAIVKSTATKKTLPAGEEPNPEDPEPEDPEPEDPTPDPEAKEFVATHIMTDFDDSEGVNLYAIELGNAGWQNSGWGVDGGTYYSFYIVASKKGNGVLPNGIYTLDSSYGPNTIIDDYSFRYQMENGDLVNGMELYKDANLTITDGKIEANIEFANGDIYHVVYEGSLAVEDGTTQAPTEFEATHTATKWLWGGSSNYGNKYQVSGENFSLDVHFQADKASSNALVAGEYIWSSTSFFGYNDFEDFTTRTFVVDGTSVAVDAGLALVSNNGEEYHIELTLEGRDGFVYMIEYNGKLNDNGEDVGGEGTTLKVTALGKGTYTSAYYFYTFKATGENLSFDLILNDYDAREEQIAAGSYTYAPGISYAGNDNLFFVNNFKYNDTSYKPTDASTLTVEGDGSNVVLTLNIVTNTNDTFVITYNGVVGGTATEGGNTTPAEPTKLATPVVAGMVSGNNATINWNEIAGAKSYTVTLNGANAKTVETAYITYQNLDYATTYTVAVVANPADSTTHTASDAGTATFTTEANTGGDEGGNTEPSESYEDWQFSATLNIVTLEVTLTDGSHTVSCTLSELAGATFSFDGGSLYAYNVKVNGVDATSASGTIAISSAMNYHVVIDATINGVRYTGTSSNAVA